jgi:ABC-2 type transport system permease protein
MYERAGGGNYLQFLAPGVIAMSILFTSIFSGIEIIWDRQFGFLKETMVAPVPRIHIMLGRTLGGATVAILQGLIVFTITLIAGFRPESWSMLPLAFAFMFLIALLFTALGTGIASILEDFQGFQLIMNFLVMPLFFLSGALFPLDGLPPVIAFITRIDPLTYGVDALRAALLGASHFPLVLDFSILAIVTVVFLCGGSYLFSKIEV